MELTLDIEILIGPVQPDALQNALNALRTQADYAILESLIAIRFPSPQTTEIKLEDWPKGRIFAPAFELRWEKPDENYRSVLSKENSFEWPTPELSKLFTVDANSLQHFHYSDPQEVYLWPEHDMRLGRRLEYECLPNARDHSKKNVKLETRLYRDAYGRLIFWRYRKMRWAE